MQAEAIQFHLRFFIAENVMNLSFFYLYGDNSI